MSQEDVARSTLLSICREGKVKNPDLRTSKNNWSQLRERKKKKKPPIIGKKVEEDMSNREKIIRMKQSGNMRILQRGNSNGRSEF